MHAAIYDAVVSITHSSSPYLFSVSAPPDARPEAAAAEAGHDTTVASNVLPGVVRTFDSYSAAATEAGLSRIYGGVHTRIDHEADLRIGHQVAVLVLEA